MRLHKTLLASVALCALAACKSEEDLAREILAEALQSYAVLQDDSASTQSRLEAGQAVTEALQRIVSEHGATDLGLEIAAGGTVGEMSPDTLRQQIKALQDLRALELCDDEPTATCVVDQLAGDLLLKDRAELIAHVPAVPAIFMALATGETEAAREWLHMHPREPMGGLAVAMAPRPVLTPQLVDTALNTLPDDLIDQMSLLAAWRILTGPHSEELRTIAQAGVSGRAVMEMFGSAEGPEAFFAALTEEAEQEINWDNLRRAEAVLGLFEGVPQEGYPLSILVSKFGLRATMDAIPAAWEFEPEHVQSTLGTEAARLRVETILADPASSPRALSLALMRAPLLIPKEELGAMLAARKDAEVMTWDNVRILPTFVALGYLWDRALFDAVKDLLTEPSMSDYLGVLWETGRTLEAGRLSQTAVADDLMSRALGRDDLAVAAYACGMTAVMRDIALRAEDLSGYIGPCDRARLGTMPAELSDEDFGFYLENADLLGEDAVTLIRDSLSAAPARAYGFVRAVKEDDRQVDLAGVLAFALARAADQAGQD
ncbi:MAG: hypothetical protein IE922_06590 [Sphingomonadales bacterium]|nr:hypothetical protein [Sphingomonadales bacterium]